jgi:predicted RNase H-like nuclease (RuvC/YqgF family)
MLRIFKVTGLSCLLVVAGQYAFAENLNRVLDSSKKKVSAAAQSQKTIDGLSDQTQNLFNEFKVTESLVSDLKVYNKKLQIQVDNQQQRLQEIEQAITQVSVMQRQMLPLIERMINQLEQFVALDLPFHIDEREERIAFLKGSLERSDLSTAEKFRQLLEAWKIENEYGRKVESYAATILLEGIERDVQILRVGRLAMLYQTLDSSLTGAWDKNAKSWQPLDSGQFNKATRQAIKMANKQANIDVMTIPVPQAESFK